MYIYHKLRKHAGGGEKKELLNVDRERNAGTLAYAVDRLDRLD
jgi:hypothetical protein